MSQIDLIAEHFRRDLSEAEDEALARELAASPEAALRFAGLAEDEYRAFGLPEPPLDGPRRGRLGLWLLGGVGLLWLAWPKAHGTRLVQMQEAQDGALVVAQPEAPRPVELPQAAEVALPTPRPRLRVSSQTPVGPFQVDVLGADAEAVGISDAKGRAVAAFTVRGPRSFFWDGLDGQGQRVAPGRYALQVRVGDLVLKQWVEIEVR